MTAREIAEKYVYGKHDALTDNQEVEDMVKDIEDYVFSKMGWIKILEDGSNLPYDDNKLYKVHSPLEDLSEYPAQCWARVHVMTSKGRGSITHYREA